MSHSENQDNRKHLRRDHLKKKGPDRYSDNTEYRDQNKMKKQFKRQKQQLKEDEDWENWKDEIS